MREGPLFGTMFGLGAGAVLVGVTVSRLVVGQAPERAAEEPPTAAVETVAPAVVESPPPAVDSSTAPAAEIALAGQHRALPRKHRRPPVAEVAMPRPKPVLEQTPSATPPIAKRETPTAAPPPPVVKQAPPPPAVEQAPPATASIPDREAPTAVPLPPPVVEQTPATTASIPNREETPAVPPRAEVADAPTARHQPIVILRGGIARAGSRGPGPHIIRVESQDR